MTWNPKTFDEACKRAAGRRAYNRARRLKRAKRILRILELLDKGPIKSGRDLAARLGVHESTISRDLKFIVKVMADFRRGTGARMFSRNFRWIEDARGYETKFLIRNGVRVK
jgi:predicted DNA-binding transcriptional regulator YafY